MKKIVYEAAVSLLRTTEPATISWWWRGSELTAELEFGGRTFDISKYASAATPPALWLIRWGLAGYPVREVDRVYYSLPREMREALEKKYPVDYSDRVLPELPSELEVEFTPASLLKD